MLGSFIRFNSPYIIWILNNKRRVIYTIAVYFQEYYMIRDISKNNHLRVPSINDSNLLFYSEIHYSDSTNSTTLIDLEPKELTSP